MEKDDLLFSPGFLRNCFRSMSPEPTAIWSLSCAGGSFMEMYTFCHFLLNYITLYLKSKNHFQSEYACLLFCQYASHCPVKKYSFPTFILFICFVLFFCYCTYNNNICICGICLDCQNCLCPKIAKFNLFNLETEKDKMQRQLRNNGLLRKGNDLKYPYLYKQ